jgi:hypothetical protein
MFEETTMPPSPPTDQASAGLGEAVSVSAWRRAGQDSEAQARVMLRLAPGCENERAKLVQNLNLLQMGLVFRRQQSRFDYLYLPNPKNIQNPQPRPLQYNNQTTDLIPKLCLFNGSIAAST